MPIYSAFYGSLAGAPRGSRIRRLGSSPYVGGNERSRSSSRRNSLHVSRPDPNPSMPMPMDPGQEHNYQRRQQPPSYYEQKPPEAIGHDPLHMKQLLEKEKLLDISTPGAKGHDPAFLKKYLKKYGTPYTTFR